MSGPKWMERALVAGPHVALCTSEKEFRAALRHLKVKCPEPWMPAGASACVSTYDSPGKGTASIVCIKVDDDRDSIMTAGILVHEAVHVWQDYCETIREHKPSAEFEAYSIQAIAQRLMEAYPKPKEHKRAKVNAR